MTDEAQAQDRMEYDDVVVDLKQFLESRFLPDGTSELDVTSPLLRWGILNSVSTMELIAYIRDRYGVYVPPNHIVGSNFKSLDTITKLVISLKTDPSALS